ncbi:beta-ketoacyl-ACP synthase III [Gilvimarinus sp. F26214L]|uniref:beta-ketoacyl-ACP synthase III n=1 Tax=Gilvimarinus sp. DZF01 TaxID=3461371 RepID=UPI0040463D31
MALPPVYITNIASFLPNEPVDNDNMERILGQVGGRPSRARRLVLRSNGIQSRYYAIDPQTLRPNYTNAQLTARAVQKLEQEGFDLGTLGCLSCGTSIADQLMPNHAVMVQGELELAPCEVVATSGVCLAGMTAMKYAYLAVASGEHRSAVATGSELSSAMMRGENFKEESEAQLAKLGSQPELAFEKDFLRWMLSDGAGAVLLQSTPAEGRLSLRIDWLHVYSYAGEIDTCMYAGAVKNADGSITGWQQFSDKQRREDSVMAVKQDVKLLNENVLHYTVERPLIDLIERYQLRAEQFDYFIPHYSSNFFAEGVYASLKRVGLDIPRERWFTNLNQKGNTGSASIYIMLDELYRSGRLQAGETLLCYIPESGRFSSAMMKLTVVG